MESAVNAVNARFDFAFALSHIPQFSSTIGGPTPW
jgi:hypothetical protein